MLQQLFTGTFLPFFNKYAKDKNLRVNLANSFHLLAWKVPENNDEQKWLAFVKVLTEIYQKHQTTVSKLGNFKVDLNNTFKEMSSLILKFMVRTTETVARLRELNSLLKELEQKPEAMDICDDETQTTQKKTNARLLGKLRLTSNKELKEVTEGLENFTITPQKKNTIS